MNCLYAKPAGSRVACHEPSIAKGKRYTFVPSSRCDTCPLKVERGPGVPLPVIDDCVHRSGPQEIEANCGCQGVKTLDLYTCEVHGKCSLNETDFERIKETFRRRDDGRKLVNCAGCRDHWIPELDDTEILYVHYNPCGYTRTTANVFKWFASLGPLQRITRGLHLVFRADEPTLPNATRVSATDGQAFFIKESLVNLAARTSTAKYIAWVDADIVYPDSRWLMHGLRLLDQFDAVQLFAGRSMLDEHGQPAHKQPGRVAAKLKEKDAQSGNPGGAWLMRRETFESIGGLPEMNLVGGGDTATFDAWTQQERALYWDWMGDDARAYWSAYRDRCRGVIHRLAFVPYTPSHLYHGDGKDRYGNRQELLRGMTRADVRIADNGLPEIVNPDLLAAVRGYMRRRNEDR